MVACNLTVYTHAVNRRFENSGESTASVLAIVPKHRNVTSANDAVPFTTERTMIELKVWNGYNEKYAPQGAKKAYVARIKGRDSKMTFNREFLGMSPTIDEPGLFELRKTDNKGRADDGYRVIAEVDGELKVSITFDKPDAMRIAKAMDEGRSIEQIVKLTGRPGKNDPTTTVYDIEIMTAKQAEKATVGQTIESAINGCWELIKNLPEKDAKKVMAALKVKVSPPKPAEPIDTQPEAPQTNIEEPKD